jgi:DNA mismatch repair protein MSH6
LYESATYTKRKVGDFSKLLHSLQFATEIPPLFEKLDIQSGLLLKIVRTIADGGCFPDMAEELEWFFNNFNIDQAADGIFEPSPGIDARYDDACETIRQIEASLAAFKDETCRNRLRHAPSARSTWKYVNTQPDSKDKYLIELPASIRVPEDFLMKAKRGNGAKQINKYRTSFVEQLVDELETALEIKKERKAIGMRLIFAKFDSKRASWVAMAHATAMIDALGSMAITASKAGYVRPAILDCSSSDAPTIRLVEARHPGVETTIGSDEFIPNNLCLGGKPDSTTGNEAPRVLLLSGPNMGGSRY